MVAKIAKSQIRDSDSPNRDKILTNYDRLQPNNDNELALKSYFCPFFSISYFHTYEEQKATLFTDNFNSGITGRVFTGHCSSEKVTKCHGTDSKVPEGGRLD